MAYRLVEISPSSVFIAV